MPSELEILQMGPEKAREWFLQGSDESAQAQPVAPRTATPTLPPSVTPATHAALANAGDIFKIIIPNTYVSPEMKRMGMREGVFLNTDKGAPGDVRRQLGMDEHQINQFKYLVSKYGPENVDLSDEGRFILRNQPAQGTMGGFEDVMVDPIGMDKGDLAEMSGQVLPLLGELAAGAAFGGKGTGAKGVIKKLVAQGVGAFAVGAVQDGMVRYLRGHDIDPKSIVGMRALQAIGDVALGLAMAGGGKALSKMGEGYLGTDFFGDGAVDVGLSASERAQKVLFEKTAALDKAMGGKGEGVLRPMTPGETAMSAFLQRSESVAKERAGAAGLFDEVLKSKQKAEGEFLRTALGLPREMSDEELAKVLPRRDLLGQAALDRLRSEAAFIEGKAGAAGRDILKTGTKEIQDIAGLDLNNPLDVSAIGEMARGKVVGDLAAFKAPMRKRYEDFLSKPEVTARSVPGDSLAKAVADVEQKFVPAATKLKATEVQTVDAYGSPTARTRIEQKEEALDAFVPAKFRGFANELGALKGAKVAVGDLKQIRTSIDNAIAEGEAIPGVNTAQLTALRDAVDENITGALKGIDPKLLTEWKALGNDYAKGMDRFKQVKRLLIEEGEPGSIGNAAIAGRLQGNSDAALDAYNSYKNFFGAGSPEFKALQQAAKQDILIGTMGGDGLAYMQGNKVLAALQNTRPEIAKELFGTDKAALEQIAIVLERAKGKNLDVEQMLALANSKTLTATKVQALLDAEGEVNRLYNNGLIKAASKGALDAEKIEPSTFVRRAIDMDESSLKMVLGTLSSDPKLLDDIRKTAVMDLWGRVQAGAINEQQVTPLLLRDALGDEARKASWTAIVGKETVEALEALLESVKKDGGAILKGGAIAGSSDFAKIALGGELGAIKSMAGRFLVAHAYTGPLKRSISNMFKSQDRGDFLNALVTSEPFVSAVLEQYGSDVGWGIMNALRGEIEPIQQRLYNVKGERRDPDFDPTTLPPEEAKAWFLNSQGQ